MKNNSIVLTVGLAAAAVAACDRDRDRDARPAEGVTTPTEVREPRMEETEREEVSGTEREAVGVVETEKKDASELLNDAAETLREMKADPKIKQLLQQSSGVFIVPEYGRGAVGVGARGGEGVLLAQRDGKWSDPVFYDIGGISVGAQFGAEGGEIAMLLMSDQALDSFKGDDTFSFNAGAKLTIVDYSALSKESLGKDAGDVVFWSDTEGAFAGAALSATNISWDDEENNAFHGGKKVTPEEVLSGKVAPSTKGALQRELSEL